MNRVNARSTVDPRLRFLTGNDEYVFVPGSVIVDVGHLLVDVPFHPSAEGRIKLSEIADLHFHVVGHSLRLRHEDSPGAAPALQLLPAKIDNYFSRPLKYFSASMAAAQPEPAAVTACL